MTMSKKQHAETEKAGRKFLLWKPTRMKTKKQCSLFSLIYNTCEDHECLRVKEWFPTDPSRKTFSQTTHKIETEEEMDTMPSCSAENVSWPNTWSVTFLQTAALKTNTICNIHCPAVAVMQHLGDIFLGLLNSPSSQLQKLFIPHVQYLILNPFSNIWSLDWKLLCFHL